MVDTENEENIDPKNNFIVLLTDGQGSLTKIKMLEKLDDLNNKT